VERARSGRGSPLLSPRLLLDIHILLRWLGNPQKLSREQVRAIEAALKHSEQLAVSATSLIEIALLSSGDKPRIKAELHDVFDDLTSNVAIHIAPITCAIALEVASLAILRDPNDRIIVATARVHRLKLVTSDQRIIASGLVPVIG
jgi:PIN domain nuclease of toxin-antitoxin system